ncbi:MAG: hypothetical protein ACLFR0_07725 [Alphaproteobacteria bacterium]
MSEKKINKREVLIAVLFIAVGILAYYLYQESRTETVGISIGGKELSATIQQ